MLALTSQIILDKLLETPNTGRFNYIKFRMLLAYRRVIIKYADPLVRYFLDGSELMLPFSHDLPLYRKMYPQYSTNLARVTQQVVAKYPTAGCIDIGANVGDTVALLRSRVHTPILCLEGDSHYFSILQMNLTKFNDVYLEQIFVSSKNSQLQGSLNLKKGSAQFVEDKSGGKIISTRTLSDILQMYPLFTDITRIIKIDTDGFDCIILQSELALLAALKPVIFFEYDPHLFNKYTDDGFKIFESLRQVGYQYLLIWENVGDYLLSVELHNQLLLEDIHHFYSGRSSNRYCDICALHTQDEDIFHAIRQKEIEFFTQFRTRRILPKVNLARNFR